MLRDFSTFRCFQMPNFGRARLEKKQWGQFPYRRNYPHYIGLRFDRLFGSPQNLIERRDHGDIDVATRGLMLLGEGPEVIRRSDINRVADDGWGGAGLFVELGIFSDDLRAVRARFQHREGAIVERDNVDLAVCGNR